MKPRDRLALLLGAALLGTACIARDGPRPRAEPPAAPAPAQAATPAPPAPTAAPRADVFQDAVRPILLRHCAPCHEPGGKMYDRLPFDDPSVVASHPEGILKRLKDDTERKTVEEWIRARAGT